MINRTIEADPQRYTRIGGLLYLAIIVFGAFAEAGVTQKLLVSGDMAASARNILAQSGLWNLGIAANLLVVVFAVPLLCIEYYLLRPVSRHLALLAVLFNLVSLAAEAISKLNLLLVLPILSSTEYASALGPQQLQVLAGIALKSHNIAFHIALLFFGFTCLLSGYMIVRSLYLPKFVGVLMQLAGACYVIAGFSRLVAPALADLLVPWILLPPLVGESSYCLWLLVKGVNVAKWRERLAQPAPA